MTIHLDAALLQSAVGCTAERASLYAPLLREACRIYSIDETPQRMAAFLAQIGHESASFVHTVEVWGPTPAQARYEGRADLGNTQSGDGWRYRGRGLIQTTGRHNYRTVTARLRQMLAEPVPDFEDNPDALSSSRWAALSAADYWDWRKLNALADVEPPADEAAFVEITRRINGGTNGLQDRLARWRRALDALQSLQNAPGAPIAPAPTPPPAPPSASLADPYAVPGEPAQTRGADVPTYMIDATNGGSMPLPTFVAAALPAIVEAIPKLGRIFGSGSDVAERNIKAAELAVEIVREATGTPNAQAAAEAIKADPAARQAADAAVTSRWLEIAEAGGGGIEGARRADAAARSAGDLLQSPSFWVTLALLPLVYMVVGSIVGLWGAEWPSDVRAAIATAVVSLIVGGAAGYYWGQTTSRNRTPPN